MEEQNKPAMISVFAHENAMMHKDADNQRIHEENSRLHTTIRIICATFIGIIVVFVTLYTIRTKIWNDTITNMNVIISEMANRASITEVANGVHQQPN